MTDIPVSVVIVSRERPMALRLCLTGISQLHYPEFEIVVVADAQGIEAARDWANGREIKLVPFEAVNMSEARNQGIAHAAGEVVAFIDDDAVPEPMWLHHLIAPFEADNVAIAGGFVRGRNGITFQWRARTVDATGTAFPLTVEGDEPRVLMPAQGRAIKTEGTNMAVRRDVLVDLGGFDPAFRFFLDETDLNLRAAAHGYGTAIVPLAEVHHGYLESSRRAASRAPRDLFEIGASQAVFLRKHLGAAEDQRGHLRAFAQSQHKRLLRYMVRGDLTPDDVMRLMRQLRKGFRDGQTREFGEHVALPRSADGFRPWSVSVAGHRVLATRPFSARAQRRNAQELVTAGERVSLFVFSRSSLFHRVTFRPEGFWEQKGGLFGKSDRAQGLVKLHRFKRRLNAELKRIARQRGLSPNGDL